MSNTGKSVTLVGYLLFHLIAIGERTILQTEAPSKNSLGFIFDDHGVREISANEAQVYDDGKPCYLLVSADGTKEYPSKHFRFCSKIIAVTSPNINSKPDLKNWAKQTLAEEFVVPPPSCSEVVYLLYVKLLK
jgi:hypothetical protein